MEQDNKKMEAFYSATLREIVEQVNARNIQREDVVQVLPNNGGFILLYYK